MNIDSAQQLQSYYDDKHPGIITSLVRRHTDKSRIKYQLEHIEMK